MPEYDQDNDQSQQHPKIRFNNPSIGSFGNQSDSAASDETAFPLPDSEDQGSGSSSSLPADHEGPSGDGSQSVIGSRKIRAFVKDGRHSETWLRQPNHDGTGATHVRTFHSKLNDESLAYMDRVINEWLAEHTECEVKFVSTTVGMFTGKVKEPALICQVWV